MSKKSVIHVGLWARLFVHFRCPQRASMYESSPLFVPSLPGEKSLEEHACCHTVLTHGFRLDLTGNWKNDVDDR